ncbi:hypothetical protein FHR75_001782 [Kineococcus radiotolerans]|uniref:Antitoxin n=2 Tax=Kineococcus radiotolerans TaxID=131568 RepID=A6W4X3_KINRD|nr:type II toxin-antitoxin system Phd/YefM family antitoxin [Kineococcus radiotolerans]ABS01862.1 hypothetical protein Krad_0372 [Kineococcus radiotolerans SRS30216 = ATCC BAA-149]MBB2900994.1 hypothetical protein [Kineococcus radiotolerans]
MSEQQSDVKDRDTDWAAEYAEARERVAEFHRDAREDPAAAIYPHADVADVELPRLLDGIVEKPLVITRQGAEAAVVVSVDFFNRAHAAVELLEDDATVGSPD